MDNLKPCAYPEVHDSFFIFLHSIIPAKKFLMPELVLEVLLNVYGMQDMRLRHVTLMIPLINLHRQNLRKSTFAKNYPIPTILLMP